VVWVAVAIASLIKRSNGMLGLALIFIVSVSLVLLRIRRSNSGP